VAASASKVGSARARVARPVPGRRLRQAPTPSREAFAPAPSLKRSPVVPIRDVEEPPASQGSFGPTNAGPSAGWKAGLRVLEWTSTP
jgi:hypothetical protein